MAQLSSNTLAYQQIYERLRSFFLKDARKEFESNQQRLEEYNAILADLHYSVSAPSAKYVAYIKGEPPVSSKVNSFIQAMSLDVRNISSQSDFLSAKVVNAFNMFALEVENEKAYLDRIGSKAKILQMYNRSESEDLVYFGDSFENMDYLDIAKIKKGQIPLVKNGFATFPITQSASIPISSVEVLNGNGFAGNNHQVINDLSEEGGLDYRFVGISSPSIGNARSLSDDNPLTFFEYEGLRVDKSAFSGNNIPSDNEFKYVSTVNYSDQIEPNSLLDWSNFDGSELHFTVSLEVNGSRMVNSIDVLPYFKSQKIVKVSSVKVFTKDGSYEEILVDPIYIGSSMSPLNIDIASSYFYNKANIRFSERLVSKVHVTFEQSTPQNIEILHSYWRPNYDENDNSNSPFKGQSRFNPDSLVGYSSIEYNNRALLPKVDDPFFFKRNDNVYISQPVYLTQLEYENSFHVLKFTDQTSEIDFYFSSFLDFDAQEDNYPENIEFSSSADFSSTSSTSVRRYDSEDDGEADLSYLISFFANNGTLISDGVYEISSESMFGPNDPPEAIGENNITINISDIALEVRNETVNPATVRYDVPLSRENVILPAERFAIGIRDISLYYEEYDSGMEIVSKPFIFPSELENVMVDVDMSVDSTHVNDLKIEYYISVEDGKWIQISPIQLGFSGVPEVISFNSQTPRSQMLSGVSYLDYPNVPSPVKQVRFKISASKGRNINFTPKINSYQIVGKVKL